MNNKVLLVTGSTDGIGKQIAIDLAQLGATVLIHARSFQRGEPVIKSLRREFPGANFDLFVANLEVQHEIEQMAKAIQQKYDCMHALINNAAIYMAQRCLSADEIEKTFAVNHLAPFLLTHLLLPLLKKKKGSRIINISSDFHYAARFDLHNLQGEKEYNSLNAYRNSKLCNILFTYELAERLRNDDLQVNALHPGLANTKLFRQFTLDGEPANPKDGADTPVFLASSGEVDGITGSYFSCRLPKRSSGTSYKKKLRKQLWIRSEKLIQAKQHVSFVW